VDLGAPLGVADPVGDRLLGDQLGAGQVVGEAVHLDSSSAGPCSDDIGCRPQTPPADLASDVDLFQISPRREQERMPGDLRWVMWL
jgi:hypothetical protein